jgi:two-component system, LytTR family, sensor kinase
MWKPNCKIAFDDRSVMLFAIPLFSFIVPIVFFGCRFNREPYFNWRHYTTTLVITSVLWIGNRYILIWFRNKYPLFKELRKRLLLQLLCMFIFTVIFNNLLGYLFDDVLFDSLHHVGMSASDVAIKRNAAALFSVAMVIAIYESVYFMHELRTSVEEKEMLKRESLHAQLDALRTQVNPHFLFNNLNTLVAIIPENPEQAIDFVQQLSKVYRHILEVKDEQSIFLKDELEVMKAYAFLLKTRFGNNLDIEINIAEEKLSKKIVPLSLQLLMENAIKHNIVSADKPLHIKVYDQNGSLTVSNNLQMKMQVNESTGIGLDNIRNRYKLLGEKIVTVIQNETNFTVSIPLIENIL